MCRKGVVLGEQFLLKQDDPQVDESTIMKDCVDEKLRKNVLDDKPMKKMFRGSDQHDILTKIK